MILCRAQGTGGNELPGSTYLREMRGVNASDTHVIGIGSEEHWPYRTIAFFRLTPKGEYEESWRES